MFKCKRVDFTYLIFNILCQDCFYTSKRQAP